MREAWKDYRWQSQPPSPPETIEPDVDAVIDDQAAKKPAGYPEPPPPRPPQPGS